LAKYHELVRPLDEDEYTRLKASIAQHGVLVPVEVDESGEILDGWHRARACEELGIRDYPRIIRGGFAESEKPEHVLTLNYDRRHLTKTEQKKRAAQVLEENPDMSDRAVAAKTGLSDHTVAQVRATAQIAQLDHRVGRDGKSRPARRPAVVVANKREQDRVIEALKKKPSLPGKMLTTSRAVRLGREAEAERRAEEARQDMAVGEARLLLGDMRERGAEVSDGSVDLIFTDPPYGADFLPLWADLGAFAVRTLKSNGMLVAYSGSMYLPQVMAALGKHLAFWWCGAVVLRGPHARIHTHHIAMGSKPLLFYVRDGFKPGPWFEDTYFSEARQKDDHAWQQSLGAAAYFVAKVCPKGGLVVDPFLGAGTTGVATIIAGRCFVGIEVDKKAIAAAQRRLRNVKA